MSRYRVQNPVTGEVVEIFEAANDQLIEQVLASADAAYREWREQSIQDRAAIVRRVSELFEERKVELAKIIAQEMGKPLSEGIQEVEFAASIINYYGVHGPSLAVDHEIPS
ncbi:MAG TPA: aldehyde dehydrogenase family protein, partial [Acidimicrobiia bacterium]